MITCPECGLQAPDDAKFCDRCGQGLTATAAPARVLSTRPTPLAPGTIVRGYEVGELIAQDSVENRYRAVRKSDGKEEKVTLRERIAQVREEPEEETVEEAKPATAPEPVAVDPNAKTAELKPPPGMSVNGETPTATSAIENKPLEAAANPTTTSGSGVDAATDVATETAEQSEDLSGATEPPAEPPTPPEHSQRRGGGKRGDGNQRDSGARVH